MILYGDPTTDDSLLLALRVGKRILGIRRFVFRRGQHENVFPIILRFLKSMGAEVSDIRKMVIVNGPGRFSSLRVMTVIANMFAWSCGWKLSAARRPLRVTDDARYLAALDRAERPAHRIAPFYGKPPSITRPTQ